MCVWGEKEGQLASAYEARIRSDRTQRRLGMHPSVFVYFRLRHAERKNLQFSGVTLRHHRSV